MAGYSPYDRSISAPGNTFTGVVTNQPVSSEFTITEGGSLNLVIKITAASVTVVGGITAKLQTAIGSDWVDSKTVAIAATGSVYLKFNVEVTADQTYLPLLSKGRIVITTTNAGDAATISAVNVLQAL